jgi:EAL and modified HD-GYP domain-containing signal transduction protein
MVWLIAAISIVIILLVIFLLKSNGKSSEPSELLTAEVEEKPEPQPQKACFLQRIPVFNNTQKITGYEVTVESNELAPNDIITRYNLLVAEVTTQDIAVLCGDKKLYVKTPQVSLVSGSASVLPERYTVFVINAAEAVLEETTHICQTLKQQGYQLALSIQDEGAFSHPLYKLADYLFIEFSDDYQQLSQLINHARGERKRIVVSQINEQSQFEQAKSLGVNAYQGYYFSQPETLDNQQVGPQVEHAMQLFNLVMSQASQEEIEQAFKMDTVLAFTLLKYINSAGFGIRNEVSSIKSALVFLGYEKLARWLGVLMASTNKVDHGAQEALFELATKRARLMELLGEKQFSESERDGLFMTGMFSVLDAMLGMPMDKALEHLNLPELAMQALLEKEGRFHDVLQLAIACEHSALEEILPLSEKLGWLLTDINQKQLAAVEWANSIKNV